MYRLTNTVLYLLIAEYACLRCRDNTELGMLGEYLEQTAHISDPGVYLGTHKSLSVAHGLIVALSCWNGQCCI